MITKNAEYQFLKDGTDIMKNEPSQRCLYLRSSLIDADKDEWFPRILEILRTYFEERFDELYLCHDHDLFITGRFWTFKHLEEFLTHLSPQLSSASAPGLASLFEFSVHWSQMRTICEKKIENFEFLLQQAQRKNKKTEKLDKVGIEETCDTIDPDLISSLTMRREYRDNIEIMIVEDDLFSQKLIRNAIGKRYPLSMTEDGHRGILNYVNKAPDVLFLDIGLPDINGHEVLKRVFEIDPNAYVVMFSGNGDHENVMKAVELGAKGFVGKPFTKEKLVQYINKSPFIQAKQKQEDSHGNTTHQ